MDKITFVEVKVLPPCSETYFQLYRDGAPTNVICSESHLKLCLDVLSEFLNS